MVAEYGLSIGNISPMKFEQEYWNRMSQAA